MQPLKKLLLCAAMLAITCGASSAQDKKFDQAQVRSNFEAASAEHFEYITSELSGLDSEKRNDLYWLAHVKPKKPGHYYVRYTFKYNDRFYTSGDFKIAVRVGKPNCDRQSGGIGISRFCLGDTVILPVRAANRYDYEFSIKFTPDGDPEIERPSTYATLPDPPAVTNPLSANLKYIGTTRSEMFHRNGGSTITYSAVFEAVAPGRFNLVLGRSHPDLSKQTDPMEGAGTPVLIVGPGESITALAIHEDTINYADDGKFQSTSGGTFSSTLLVLRPGDTFALPFSSTVTGRPGKYVLGVDKAGGNYIPVPTIQSVRFYINPKFSYNQFIAEFFNK